MAPFVCQNCGASASPEARFCRLCGAPLRHPAEAEAPISPLAATVPLKEEPAPEEARPTEGLAPHEPRYQSPPETGRVERFDTDEIYERPRDASTAGYAGEYYTRPEERRDAAAAYPPSHESSSAAEPSPPDFAATMPAYSYPLSVESPAETLAFIPSEGQQTYPASAQPPQQVRPLGTPAPGAASSPPGAHIAPRPGAAVRVRWPIILGGALVLLMLIGAAAFLAWRYTRDSTETARPSATPLSPEDQRQRVAALLADAETLRSGGNLQEAIVRLREAVGLDSTSTEARRRLGDLLLQTGARGEAISEYRAALQSDPNDIAALRSMASAQFDEGLYSEAVVSYQQLIDSPSANADDATRLAYADAMRMAGMSDQARALYERLTSSLTSEVAASARQRLTELAAAPSPSPTASPTPRDRRDLAQNQNGAVEPTPTPATVAVATPTPIPTSTPTPTPQQAADPYQRGVELWGSNRAAAVAEFRRAAQQGNPNAHYYLGLNLAQGRNPESLSQFELVQAMQHFQNAQRSGFAAQARQHYERLGREYDRRRRNR